jgi:hypothetical protein
MNTPSEDLIRLSSILAKHGKPKRKFGKKPKIPLTKAEKSTVEPVFNPPLCQPFRVEDEIEKTVQPDTHVICQANLTLITMDFMEKLPPITDIQTPRMVHSYFPISDFPISDEDGSESPTIGSNKILSWPEESTFKRMRTQF